MRILLLGEELASQEEVHLSLASQGIQCLVATQSTQARTLLARVEVQLVVVEALLADASGVDWIAQVRSQGYDFSVLFLAPPSFFEPNTLRRLVRDWGVSRILQQPLSHEELISAIKSLVPDALWEAKSAYTPKDWIEVAPGAYRLPEQPAAQSFTASFSLFLSLETEEHRVFRTGIPGELEDHFEEQRPILLVLDEEAASFGERLQEEVAPDFQVRCLVEEEDIASCLAKEQVAAVLVDWDWSGSGCGVRWVRQAQMRMRWDGVLCFFWSSAPSLAKRREALQVGCDFLLKKDITPRAFAAMVRSEWHVRQSTEMRLLLVEPDEVQARGFLGFLETVGVQGFWLKRPESLMETLSSIVPDVLLLANEARPIHGMELCRVVRSSWRWRSLPILLWGSRWDASSRWAALEAGADEILERPVVLQEFLARLRLHWRRRVEAPSTSSAAEAWMLDSAALQHHVSVRLADATRLSCALHICVVSVVSEGTEEESFVLPKTSEEQKSWTSWVRETQKDGEVWGWYDSYGVLVCLGWRPDEVQQRLDFLTNSSCQANQHNNETLERALRVGVASFPEDGVCFGALFEAAKERLPAVASLSENINNKVEKRE